jgi:hypothetical protein
MASVRRHAFIERDADDVWGMLCDPAQLPTWFRTVESARVVDDLRHLTLKRGGEVTERLLTVDDELRRFRYGVESGLPVESHLGTVDVIAVGPGRSLVVYAADVEPHGAASGFDRSIEGALVCLKELLESETA